MRVVMLSTNMARGGAETVVAELAMELRRRGLDVHVVSMLPPSAFVEELASAGVPLHAPRLALIPALMRRLRPQIVHCHMFHANVAGRLMRLVMPFPAVISTLHSIAESARRSDRIAVRDLLYRCTDYLADAIVGVSETVAAAHRERKAVRKPLVISNGIDTERFRRAPAARARMRRELGIEQDTFVWIAAGRLMWKKNYPALFDAFRQCSEGMLLIAGSGPDEAALRASAPPRTRFLGARSDLPDLYNAADGFVMTSLVEGLPLALLEAAATELPCVATPAGGITETGIGFIGEDVAANMKAVVAMPSSERASIGEAARRRVLERYSLKAAASQWEALYNSLM